MKASKIREMTQEEIAVQLADLNKEGYNLRVQQKTGQLQNSARVNLLKKDVARVRTELRSRELAAKA